MVCLPSDHFFFAESSGCALAVGLVMRRKAAFDQLPCALAFASPWLDLTCSGGSYIVNDDYDFVLQKGRMLGIGQAYIGQLGNQNPEASPLLCPAELFEGFPPTLVHVSKDEVQL